MKLLAVCALAASLSTAMLEGETITVTITGTTGAIRVGEGPIFGQKSYTHIPSGDPFVLTFTFDEEKGKQSIEQVTDGLITQSEIENSGAASPGVSATLQIGKETWEFGSAKKSQVLLKTAPTGKSERIEFDTATGGNRVSAEIVPGNGTFWPKNGDWRSSFSSGPLDGRAASFAADNDRVSAQGSLMPEMIEVRGVDLDGQWLRSKTSAHARSWELAHASPRGGYIVEEVNLGIVGTRPDGSPIAPGTVRYWQAWKVAAGASAPAAAADALATLPAGAGEASLSAVARFYEGLVVPSAFAVGNSPYADGLLSSMKDPALPTHDATLPVETHMQLRLSLAASPRDR